jgi:hypothetical protein
MTGGRGAKMSLGGARPNEGSRLSRSPHGLQDPVHGYPRGFLEVGPYRPANSLWVSAWQIHHGGLYTTYASGLNVFRPKMCHGEGHTYAGKMKLMHGFPFSR